MQLNEGYVYECARRLYERVKDHNSCDHSSRLVKHAGETGHLPVDAANFEVIGSGFRNNARCGNTVEALLVKKLKPTLKIQEKLVPLKLFNWTTLRHNVTSYRANFNCFSTFPSTVTFEILTFNFN